MIKPPTLTALEPEEWLSVAMYATYLALDATHTLPQLLMGPAGPFVGTLPCVVLLLLLLLAPPPGPRWQMTPLYAALALPGHLLFPMGFGLTWPWARALAAPSLALSQPLQLVLHPAVWAAASVAMALSLLAAHVLPILNLPPPSGPHRVGLVTFEVADPSRPSFLQNAVSTGSDADADAEPDTRRLLVNVWYPAAKETPFARDPPPQPDEAGWVPDARVRAALAARFSMPSWLLDHLALVPRHCRRNLCIAPELVDGRHPAAAPILILSHGWGGNRNQNESLAVEMASRGWVVFAPDHPGDAAGVFYEAAWNAPPGRPASRNSFPYDAYIREHGEFVDDPDALHALRHKHLSVRVADVSLLIDTIESLARDGRGLPGSGLPAWPLFKGALDTSNIHIGGHSFGGGTVVQALARDTRIVSGIALDPWVYPVDAKTLKGGLPSAPLLLVSAPGNIGPDNAAKRAGLVDASLAAGNAALRDVIIPDTKHHDFHDYALIAPTAMTWLGASGAAPITRVHASLNSMLVDWLEAVASGPAVQLDAFDAQWLATYPPATRPSAEPAS